MSQYIELTQRIDLRAIVIYLIPEDFGGHVCMVNDAIPCCLPHRSKYELQQFLKPGLKIASSTLQAMPSKKMSFRATSSSSVPKPVSAQHSGGLKFQPNKFCQLTSKNDHRNYSRELLDI